MKDHACSFKVLVVEDSDMVCEAYRQQLNSFDESYELIFAKDIRSGMNMLELHSDIDLVVVDGLLEDNEIGEDFVKLARKRYHGKMLAASSGPAMNEELVRLGCTYAARNKFSVTKCVQAMLLGRPIEKDFFQLP